MSIEAKQQQTGHCVAHSGSRLFVVAVSLWGGIAMPIRDAATEKTTSTDHNRPTLTGRHSHTKEGPVNCPVPRGVCLCVSILVPESVRLSSAEVWVVVTAVVAVSLDAFVGFSASAWCATAICWHPSSAGHCPFRCLSTVESILSNLRTAMSAARTPVPSDLVPILNSHLYVSHLALHRLTTLIFIFGFILFHCLRRSYLRYKLSECFALPLNTALFCRITTAS